MLHMECNARPKSRVAACVFCLYVFLTGLGTESWYDAETDQVVDVCFQLSLELLLNYHSRNAV